MSAVIAQISGFSLRHFMRLGRHIQSTSVNRIVDKAAERHYYPQYIHNLFIISLIAQTLATELTRTGNATQNEYRDITLYLSTATNFSRCSFCTIRQSKTSAEAYCGRVLCPYNTSASSSILNSQRRHQRLQELRCQHHDKRSRVLVQQLL